MAVPELVPFIIDKRYGGLSENEFISNGLDFSYSQNIDIFTNPKGIQLSKDFSQLALAPTGYITKMLRLPNNIQSNAYFSDDGKIYIDSGAGPALVYTLTDADKKILNAVCFGNNLLVFTSTDIHRITFTGNDFKTFAACTEAILSFTSDFGGFAAGDSIDLPIYNDIDAVLYFGGGTKLFSVPVSLVAISTEYTFAKGDKIVGLTYLNSNLKIYVNHTNTDSKLRFRSPATSDAIIYKNRVFKSVISDGQLDYVVCSDGLYIHSGYQYVKVFDKDFSTFGKVGTNYFPPHNMVGIDPHFRYVPDGVNLYKYGKKFTNIKNNAICLDKVFANKITAIIESMTANNVWLATDDKKINNTAATYNSSGYLETVVFYGDAMEKRKKPNRLFDAFKLNGAMTPSVDNNGLNISLLGNNDGVKLGIKITTKYDCTLDSITLSASSINETTAFLYDMSNNLLATAPIVALVANFGSYPLTALTSYKIVVNAGGAPRLSYQATPAPPTLPIIGTNIDFVKGIISNSLLETANIYAIQSVTTSKMSSTGESIDIYFSVDGGAYNGSPDLSITDVTNKRQEFFVNQLALFTNHWIKMKFVLNGVSPYTTTPILYENSLFSEYVENKT